MHLGLAVVVGHLALCASSIVESGVAEGASTGQTRMHISMVVSLP